MSSNLSPFGRSKLNQSGLNDVRINSPERDLLISQLKSQIFEYEQNEKSFNSLQSKYRVLQNDFDLVSEEKLRLEYELRQRSEMLNKQISEIRNEKENLQNSLNDKMATNKKLFNDNNNLFRTLESRNAEINSLRDQLSLVEDLNAKVNDEKLNLEEAVGNLSEVKKSHEYQLVKYKNELERFNKVCDEQNNLIKNLGEEKSNFMTRNEELNFELKNLKGKLKSKEDNLNFSQRQLEEANKNISKMEDHILDLDQNVTRTRLELNNSNSELEKEREIRNESESNVERLENILKETTNEVKRLNYELDNSRINNDKLNNEKARLFGEIERYKNHIMILTEQNQNLSEEIEITSERDEKLKQQLNRKDRLGNVLAKNKNNLEASLSNLDECLNKTSKVSSPPYQRNKQNN